MLQSLLTAQAVRERCAQIGTMSTGGDTHWFHTNYAALDDCARLVARTCTENYPDLRIPLHSRWRHFDVGSTDLWQYYREKYLQHLDDKSMARTAIDLVFTSVLLDAGAGPHWRYVEPVSGIELSRSEGLAAASVALFFEYLARDEGGVGWVVDSQALSKLTFEHIAHSFQHSERNPLLGIQGRLQLLHGLGDALKQDVNSDLRRPGDLLDALANKASSDGLHAAHVLEEVLHRFGKIWPSGLVREQINLGDCGVHSLLVTDDITSNIVPFHKLSQWLSYSLIEPLHWGGIEVIDLDALTGLPEYRNGGLLIDTEVIKPVRAELLTHSLDMQCEAVVEWRALTVCLLDQIADRVRTILNQSSAELPLCSILQGGTWTAGRQIARTLRSDGAPPINLALNGTVF